LLALYEKLGNKPQSVRRNVLGSLTNAILHLGRYPIPINYQQVSVSRDDEIVPTAYWCPDYEADFWALVRELGSAFEFLKQLPDEFLAQVESQTWRRPAR
jgi:hypothetical protein